RAPCRLREAPRRSTCSNENAYGVRSTGRGKSKPTSPTCERVASAISMIGLHPERPQRGKGASTNLQRLAANFEDEFSRHCITCDHGRPTPEKRLQSYLLASA